MSFDDHPRKRGGKSDKKKDREKKKRKSRKKEKKRKRRKKSSSRRSSSTSSSEECWVEAPTPSTAVHPSTADDDDVAGQSDSLPQRDSWMIVPPKREQRKAPEKEKEDTSKPSPSSHLVELNPHWKSNESGLPSEATKKSIPDSKIFVGDGGASWRRKALQRSIERAKEEGRSLQEVVSERHKSLGELSGGSSNSRRGRKERTRGWRKEGDRDGHSSRSGGPTHSSARSGRPTHSSSGGSTHSSSGGSTHSSARSGGPTHSSSGGGGGGGGGGDSSTTRIIRSELSKHREWSRRQHFHHASSPPDDGALKTPNQRSAALLKKRLLGGGGGGKSSSSSSSSSIPRDDDSTTQVILIDSHPPDPHSNDDDASISSMVLQEKSQSIEEYNKQFTKTMMMNQHLLGDDRDFDDFTTTSSSSRRSRRSRRSQANHPPRAAIPRHQDACFHCFDSRLYPRHLLISLGEHCYLCLPRRSPLVPGHCLIVPMKHAVSCTMMDEEVWNEINTFKSSLTRMFASMVPPRVPIFTETITNIKKKRHTTVQCIPLAQRDASVAPGYFKKALGEAEGEWQQHKRVIDTRGKRGGIRASIPPGFSYCNVEFAMGGGYAHVIEDGRDFHHTFTHQVIAGMIELPPRNWDRQKMDSVENGRRRAMDFLKCWEEYDWTLTLDE